MKSKLFVITLLVLGTFFHSVSAANAVTPTIDSVTPSSGSTSGNALITINGSDFKNIEAVMAETSSTDGSYVYNRIVKVDSEGSIYVMGDFDGTVTFGSLQATSQAGRDVFLVKYSSDGTEQWLETIQGSWENFGWSMAIDGNDDVLVTGSFRLVATFGSGTPVQLNSAGATDMFVAKYDGDGELLWAKRGGSTGADAGYSVTTNSANDVFVSGQFTSTVTFGALSSISSSGQQDVFLLKYNSSGTEQWVRKGGGTLAEVGRSVRTDADGNIYVSGYYNSATLTFGALTGLSNSGGTDGFLVKYNSSGTEQWSRKFGGSANDFAYSVATGPGASPPVYISGYVDGSASFDSINVSAVGMIDAIVARYNSDGTVQWVRTGGGPDNDAAEYVNTDADGNVYIAGYLGPDAVFGTWSADAGDGETDLYGAKYDSSGNIIWLTHGGGGYSGAYSIFTDENNDVYIAGTNDGTSQYDDISVPLIGLSDGIFLKYSQNISAALDGQACISTTFVNSTSLQCITPAHNPGWVSTAVTNPAGDIGSLASSYLYQTSQVEPTGSVSINAGATTTTSNTVTLTLTATDDDLTPIEMKVSNQSDLADVVFESYSASKPWNLTAGTGTKTVYVIFKDASQNVSTVYSDSIQVVAPAPSPSPTPEVSSSSSSTESPIGTSAPVTPSCAATTPAGTSDLFQINREGSSAKLYFTPVNDTVTRYHVIYGYKEGDERFGSLSEQVTAESNGGVQSLVIQNLDPKQTYWFKVAPVRDCAVGSWSNWLNANRTVSRLQIFYRYFGKQ